MLGIIWAVMIVAALLCALLTGRLGALSDGISTGAVSAVELIISISGIMMLWSGVMEIMRRSELTDKIARLLSPLVRLIFGSTPREVSHDIAMNMSANLLGLGNAATPAGIRAARGLQTLNGIDSASDSMCMLVIINTASLQLIPTTIAAVRSASGATNPYDIIPAVWLASIISQAAGILSAVLLSKKWIRRR